MIGYLRCAKGHVLINLQQNRVYLYYRIEDEIAGNLASAKEYLILDLEMNMKG